MIVIDSSALFAITFDEADAERCQRVIWQSDPVLMSAATLAETLIVAARRGFGEEVAALVAGIAPTIVPLTEASARAAAQAYDRWGKGVHRANLNFADCFAYALAKEHQCPLLFVGDDFSQTDIIAAAAAAGFHEP